MIGVSDEDLLIQGYLDEAKNTGNFLQQVAACREVLNIISWRFSAYEKGFPKLTNCSVASCTTLCLSNG
jgi:hypothetical protein